MTEQLDTIKAHLKIEKEDQGIPAHFLFHLEINDVEYKFYTDFTAIIVRSKFGTEIDYEGEEESTFEPFICDCGVSGCNGIYAPISSRFIEEENVVEWIVPQNMGYDFLDKEVYRFSMEEYEKMIAKTLYFMGNNDAAFMDKQEAILHMENGDGMTLMELLDNWAVDKDLREVFNHIYEIQEKYPMSYFK